MSDPKPETADKPAAEDRSTCTPCHGSGKLISGKGGNPSTVTCPWCGGDGRFHAGRNAQEFAPAADGGNG